MPGGRDIATMTGPTHRPVPRHHGDPTMTNPSEHSAGGEPAADDRGRPAQPAADLPPWLSRPLPTWKLALGALAYATMWVCAFEIDDDRVKLVSSLAFFLAACAYLVVIVRRERRRGGRRPRSGQIPRTLRGPLMLRQFLAIAFCVVVAVVGTRILRTALAGSALHWLISGAVVAIWAFVAFRLLEQIAIRSYRRWLATRPG
jgi:hypothetical protein